MENKNIIIALLLVIVVLAIVAGVMFTQNINAKEPAKLKITSNNTLTEGDNLTLHLTDMNRTPISRENVTVTVKNAKGKVVINKTVKTSSKGNAKLDLNLKKGKYVVNATFKGNENFTGNNTAQKLTVKEKVVEAKASSSESSTGNPYVDSVLNDPTCTVVKDPYAICPKHGVPYWQDNYCDWAIQPF